MAPCVYHNSFELYIFCFLAMVSDHVDHKEKARIDDANARRRHTGASGLYFLGRYGIVQGK